MTAPHLAQLREIQDENAWLKRIYADRALMDSALKLPACRVSCGFASTGLRSGHIG